MGQGSPYLHCVLCDKQLRKLGVIGRIARPSEICLQCSEKAQKEEFEEKRKHENDKISRTTKVHQMWFANEFKKYQGREPTQSEIESWIQHGN